MINKKDDTYNIKIVDTKTFIVILLTIIAYT